MTWSKYKQPLIDAATVILATLVGVLTDPSGWHSDAILIAVVTGLTVFLKALNPADTSYGVGGWRERPQPTIKP